MAKQIILILSLGILVTIAVEQYAMFLNLLWSAYNYILSLLSIIFAGGFIGSLIKKTISLLLVSTLAGIIPSLIFSLIMRKKMPRIMEAISIFLILTSASIALHPHAM